MKRSGHRDFVRLLTLESLECRRLLTTAMPDYFSLFEDSPTALLNVMSNDIVTGDVATIVRVSSAEYGNLEIRDGDKIAFTPATNVFGESIFTYTIRDQFGSESTGTAVITIIGVNDAPTINQVADIRTMYNEIGREVLLRGVTAGPGEVGQGVSINVFTSGPAIINGFEVIPTDQPTVFRLTFDMVGLAEAPVGIFVQVEDSEGLQNLMIFTVDVIGLQADTPLQNSDNILDVDGDQLVSPLDALTILNMNTIIDSPSIPASQISNHSKKVDVNGDNFVDPLDAVTVIDAIDHQIWSGDPRALAPLTPKGAPIFEFKYQIVDSDGNDADSNPDDGKVEAEIEFGHALRVRLLVRDLRARPTGIFSTYSDLVYTNVEGAVGAVIEPASIREDGSVVDSLIWHRGGLKQGQYIDNRSQVAGQWILKGVGEYGFGYREYIADNEFHVVMDILFIAKEQGTVELQHQLSEYAMGVAGIVPFNGTGDYLGPAEVVLPTARISVTGGVPIFQANDDLSVKLEDERHEIDVLGNDFDLTGTAEIVLPITPPAIGGFLFWDNERVVYLPPPNFFGTTSFTYSIRIADGREDSATVSLVVAEVNDPPIISHVAPIIAHEDSIYETEPFFVSPGDVENQIVRVVATSNDAAVLPNPIVETLGDGYFRIVGQVVEGYSGMNGILIDAEDAGNDGLFETIEDNSISTIYVPVLAYPDIGDFGDAPTSDQSGMLSSYPTRFDQNGAFHVGTALRLGSQIDKESDGEPESQAKGDDNLGTSDEDGILFPFTHPINDLESTLSSYIANVSEDGFLDSWIDFNRDGDWSDLGETISWSVPVFAGRNIIPFQIPSMPLTGTIDTTFARFRLSRQGWLSYTGYGGEGEVEDYAIVMSKNNLQELVAYDHVLGRHDVNVVDGFLIVTVGDKTVYRAPAGNISIFRRENINGETTFEMREPASNMPGQLSYSDATGMLELELLRTEFDLGAHAEFLAGVNSIQLGQSAVRNVLSLELEDVQMLNSERILRIEMNREDLLKTESLWEASRGRMENGRWVQIYTINSTQPSFETLATLEVISEAAWRNETRNTDADGDATTSPLDVLALVNYINAKVFGDDGQLPSRTESVLAQFPDVDGDQFLTALDVLNVINYLNTRGNGLRGSGEGEDATDKVLIHPTSRITAEDIDRFMYSYAIDFDEDLRSTKRKRGL